MNLQEVLQKQLRNEPMTREEAGEVWRLSYEMAEAFPDGQLISALTDHLAAERYKGERCSICGRYKDPNCGPRC